jgi:uncharacterized membrane protein
MPSTIFGLPVHPLLVHATVVFVPLAALLVILAVLVPRFRTWAGPLPAGVSLVALILTPLSTSSGENLEHDLPHSQLIEEHAELGDQLLWFTLALFVFAAAFWWLTRTADAAAKLPKALVTVVGVLAIVAAVGTGVQVARIGHSGAKAAWANTGSSSSGG